MAITYVHCTVHWCCLLPKQQMTCKTHQNCYHVPIFHFHWKIKTIFFSKYDEISVKVNHHWCDFNKEEFFLLKKWLRHYSTAAILVPKKSNIPLIIFPYKMHKNQFNLVFTHHFKIVFVKLFKSVLDKDPEFNNGLITEAQSTPPLCAAIFLVLTDFLMVIRRRKKISSSMTVDGAFVTTGNHSVKWLILNEISWLGHHLFELAKHCLCLWRYLLFCFSYTSRASSQSGGIENLNFDHVYGQCQIIDLDSG